MATENSSTLNLTEIKKQGFNRIPLVREVLADLENAVANSADDLHAGDEALLEELLHRHALGEGLVGERHQRALAQPLGGRIHRRQ